MCHNLTQTAQPSVRELFKKSIFPDSASEGVATESRPSESAQHNKERLFYFKHLTFFLTCLDTNVKRYAGEWLYLLCDQNGELGAHLTLAFSGIQATLPLPCSTDSCFPCESLQRTSTRSARDSGTRSASCESKD